MAPQHRSPTYSVGGIGLADIVPPMCGRIAMPWRQVGCCAIGGGQVGGKQATGHSELFASGSPRLRRRGITWGQCRQRRPLRPNSLGMGGTCGGTCCAPLRACGCAVALLLWRERLLLPAFVVGAIQCPFVEPYPHTMPTGALSSQPAGAVPPPLAAPWCAPARLPLIVAPSAPYRGSRPLDHHLARAPVAEQLQCPAIAPAGSGG